MLNSLVFEGFPALPGAFSRSTAPKAPLPASSILYHGNQYHGFHVPPCADMVISFIKTAAVRASGAPGGYFVHTLYYSRLTNSFWEIHY